MRIRIVIDGEERVRRRFYHMPTIIGRHTYWLESRTVRERYHSCVYCSEWEAVEVIG